MYSKDRWEKVIRDNERYYEEKYSKLELEFISEVYKEANEINKEEIDFDELSWDYYNILYPRCKNQRTLSAISDLYIH